MNKQINYISQINSFWVLSEELELSGTDVSIYMALLDYWNRLNWMNPFVCHWDIVCQKSKVSKNAYYKSLERLENSNLIEYQKGIKNTSKKPKIFILELENRKGTGKEQRGNKEGTRKEQQGNLYKLLNNQTIKLLNNNIDLVNDNLEDWISSYKSDKEIQYPFESNEFLEQWEVWKKFKKEEFKFKYKSATSEQAALIDLNKKSNGLENVAIQIIHQSIANGWKGFFELKNNNNGKSKQSFSEEANKFLAENDPDYNNY